MRSGEMLPGAPAATDEPPLVRAHRPWKPEPILRVSRQKCATQTVRSLSVAGLSTIAPERTACPWPPSRRTGGSTAPKARRTSSGGCLKTLRSDIMPFRVLVIRSVRRPEASGADYRRLRNSASTFINGPTFHVSNPSEWSRPSSLTWYPFDNASSALGTSSSGMRLPALESP